METFTFINGNGRPYTRELPLLVIVANNINDVALARLKENTGLDFVKGGFGYTAQPNKSKQIVALFMTGAFKTRSYDNASCPNQIHLKFDYHVGFDVDSICFDCAKRNHIHTGDMKPGDYLAC